MRILVIEDEVRLAEYLRKGLSENGYVVDVTHDGIDGRQRRTGDHTTQDQYRARECETSLAKNMHAQLQR